MARYSKQYYEKIVRILWAAAKGQTIFRKNPPHIDGWKKASVGPMLSSLFLAGFLEKPCRGRYEFTDKAKVLMSQCDLADAAEVGKAEKTKPLQVLILTPEEKISFDSLNFCQPKTINLPAKKKRDRIAENDIDVSQLDSDGRDRFFRKMAEAGILQEDGIGKRGRIFHFRMEKYLELCGKVQVVAPVRRKLIEMKATFSEQKQLLEGWLKEESGLGDDLKKAREKLGDLQNRLTEIKREIEDISAGIRVQQQKQEELRRKIQASGYLAKVRDMERLLPVLEPMSNLSDELQFKLMQILGLKAS